MTSTTVFEVEDIDQAVALLKTCYNQCSGFQSIRQLLQEATPRILSMCIEDLYQIGLINKLLAVEPRPGYRYMLESYAEPSILKMEADLCSLFNH